MSIWTRITNEEGQALSEYGLVVALIAIVCVVALSAIGLALSSEFDSFTNALGGGA